MSFIMMAYMVVLLIIMFMKVKNMLIVFAAGLLLFGVTAGVLYHGILAYESNSFITLFNSALPEREFFHLITAWFVFDSIGFAVVIRNYLAYRRVNR